MRSTYHIQNEISEKLKLKEQIVSEVREICNKRKLEIRSFTHDDKMKLETLKDASNSLKSELKRLSDTFGLDEELLRQMMSMKLAETTLNEFGRFDLLKNSVDKQKAKSYFENITGNTLTTFKINVKTSDLLKRFILEGGFEV